MWTKLEKLSTTERDQFDGLYVNKALLCAPSCPRIRNTVIASGKFRQCSKLLDGFVEVEGRRSRMYVSPLNGDSNRFYVLTMLG